MFFKSSLGIKMIVPPGRQLSAYEMSSYASAQRTILAEAAAVDDLVWFKSVRRVPKAYFTLEQLMKLWHRNLDG